MHAVNLCDEQRLKAGPEDWVSSLTGCEFVCVQFKVCDSLEGVHPGRFPAYINSNSKSCSGPIVKTLVPTWDVGIIAIGMP